MEIWLGKILLPVTPMFEIPYTNNNLDENLSEVGSVHIAGNKGLRTLELESFFPSKKYDFLVNDSVSTDPYKYMRDIQEVAEKNEPIRLVITETPHNFEVLIDSFSTGESDGTGDVNYKLSLTEYRRVKAIERQIPGYSKPSDSSNLNRIIKSTIPDANTDDIVYYDSTNLDREVKYGDGIEYYDASNIDKVLEKIGTVQKYDTERTMAKKLTGNGDNAEELKKKNKTKEIKEGQVLKP